MNKQHGLAMLRAKEAGALTIRVRDYSDGREKLPGKTSGWRRHRTFDPRELPAAISISAWQRRGVFFISSLELADAPDGRGDVIPQWHVSISRPGVGRCSDVDAHQALACLGMVGAEEDNHHPGIARHFWMPVDASRRVDCECKVDEAVVTDNDGYRWSNEVGGECRGCEYERDMAPLGMVAPCPIHKPAQPSDVTP